MSRPLIVCRNATTALLVVLACVYSLPNFFPEEAVLQISHDSGKVSTQTAWRVENKLKQANIAGSVEPIAQSGNLLIHFPSPEQRLLAATVVNDLLDYHYTVALNSVTKLPPWLQSIGAKPVNLGLDLRGGVYFLLEVDYAENIKKLMDNYARESRKILRDEKIRYQKVLPFEQGYGLLIRFKNEVSEEEIVRAADALMAKFSESFDLKETQTAHSIRLALSPQEIKNVANFAVQQNIYTLRNRVNEIGVAEPLVARHGNSRIVVQLPGVQDTAAAKDILGAAATLKFHLVDEKYDVERLVSTGAHPPPGTYILEENDGTPVLLRSLVILSGENVIDAASGIDQETGGPAVHITLDAQGGQKFSDITAKNVKRLMAVVFIENKSEIVSTLGTGEKQRRIHTTEKVISVARIQEPLGRRFQVTGLDSSSEARKLALLLRAGALAAPIHIAEERTIGPSLGKDNIDRGIKSILLGYLLVILFMIFYYRLFGVFASIAVTFNLFLIMAIMSLIPGATLTLPGIAGIVLTVGMAVDANVLIYERIREEVSLGLRKGSIYNCIAAGYSRALATIADANVTTLIAAVVLFVFGTGPIKGFAITLAIGIVCSMFTAIIATRCLADAFYNYKSKKILI